MGICSRHHKYICTFRTFKRFGWFNWNFKFTSLRCLSFRLEPRSEKSDYEPLKHDKKQNKTKQNKNKNKNKSKTNKNNNNNNKTYYVAHLIRWDRWWYFDIFENGHYSSHGHVLICHGHIAACSIQSCRTYYKRHVSTSFKVYGSNVTKYIQNHVYTSLHTGILQSIHGARILRILRLTTGKNEKYILCMSLP